MDIKNFAGQVLFTTEGANLCGANLRGADLRGANLRGADLRGANLYGAEGVASLGAPNGWHAHAWLRDGVLSVRVGGKERRFSEALEYWDRPEKTNRREVVAAVRYAEAIAMARGWALE